MLGECMEDNFYNNIMKITSKDNIKKDEMMSKHTSFKVGGKADYFIEVENNEKDIIKIAKLAKQYDKRLIVIGNGTNTLFSDEDIKAVILKIKPDMSYNIYDDYIQISAGT